MKNVEMKVILLEVHMPQSVKNNHRLSKHLFRILKANFEIMIFRPYFQDFLNDACLKFHTVINQYVKFGCILSDFL